MKSLRLKKALRAALLVLLLGVVGTTKMYADNITFADANVKSLCVANWDTNGDGELSYAEAAAVTNLGWVFERSSITSFDELQYFVGLTSIGISEFKNCTSLTSIEIPNSVTSIGSSAFYNCRSLISIEIPNSATSIGDYAFSWCSGLTSIEIPNSVASIGIGAFSCCSSLTSIEIPNSVTSIGNSAFSYCSSLTSIEIPNYVTSIGSGTFNYCYSLTSIEIPNSVTYIGSSAFAYCSSLTSIEIPNSVTYIGDHAFSNCSSLTSIEIPNSVASLGEYMPEYTVFSSCSGLEQIIVESGNLFYDSRDNCNAIIKTSTNELVTGCKNTVIPNSVISIGDYAFSECIGLTSIEIPNSVTSIGSSAFSGCGLTTIVIPNSVTSISSEAFSACSGLTTIEIPNSVTSISDYVFYNCSGLTTIEIPNSVVSIGSSAFSYCRNLTTIEIPNSVTSIREYAFQNCRNLTTIEIPNSVTSIDYGAFEGCSSLTSMTILADNPPTLGSNVFNNVDKSIPVYVPCGSVEAYQNANGWNEFTNIQEICTQTQTITLPTGWSWWSSYIEFSDIDGLSLLENAIGIPRVKIESKDGDYVRSKVRNGRTVWVGALTSINNEEMYKINAKDACTATIEGVVANPANHPITINRGWNWIGFPCSQSISVSEALSGFSPKNNDMIKGKSGSATYSNGTWSGTLNTLEPGKGYMYGSRSNATKTLVFQTGSRGENTIANITPENNYYQPVEDYADNMTLIAVVELDGEELRSDNYELAAFAGDECRGSVKLMYVEPINRYVAFLTVFGDKAEDLHFVLTDGATSDLSADYMTYATDGIEGTLDEPVVLRFGATDVNENAAVNVRVYPNPSEGIFNIEGQNIRKVEVFNAFGQLVYSKDSENGLMMIDLTNRASGIYLIRVVTDNGIWNHQIMKR